MRRIGLVLVVPLLAWNLGAPRASAGDGTAASLRAADRIIVKFQDDARVRLRGSGLLSLSGASLGKIEALLREHGLARLDVLFRRGEAAIDATRAEAERRSGANFNLKAYHDRVLSFGSPPMRYARALLLDDPIR